MVSWPYALRTPWLFIDTTTEYYRRSWYFHSSILNSITAWLAGVQLIPVFFHLARPWVNLQFLSENTNFYGTLFEHSKLIYAPAVILSWCSMVVWYADGPVRQAICRFQLSLDISHLASSTQPVQSNVIAITYIILRSNKGNSFACSCARTKTITSPKTKVFVHSG